MASDVIKEFLVGLGYKVDAGSERKFVDSLKNATDQAAKLALGLEAMAAAAVAAVAKVAENLDRLYFSSQRTNASAESIKALGYAFGQLGGNAQGAQSAVESIARALRTNPGNNSLINALGVQTKNAQGGLRDTVDILTDLGKVFASKPHFVAAQYGAALGLDEETVRLLESGKLPAALEEYRKAVRSVGLDTDKAAKNSNEFMTEMRRLEAVVAAVGAKIASDLTPQLTEYLAQINKWVTEHHDDIERVIRRIVDAAIALAHGFAAVVQALTPVWDAFTKTAEMLTGKEGLTAAFEALGAVLAVSVLARLSGVLRLLTLFGAMTPPAWLLAMLGIATVGGAAAAYKQDAPITDELGNPGGGTMGLGTAGRTIAKAWAGRPKWMGGTGAGLGGGAESTGEGAANPAQAKALGDAIAGTESGKAGYNAVLGNGAYGRPDKPISEMTLVEVREFGRKIRAAHGSSSALGRYQIVNTTRDAAQAALGLKDDTVYNAAVQDRMMRWIARKQGLGAWEGLKTNPAAMAAAQRAMEAGGALDAPAGSPKAASVAVPRGVVRNPGPAPDSVLAALMKGEPLSGAAGTSAPLMPAAANTNSSTTNAPIHQTTTIHVDGSGQAAGDIAGSVAKVQDGVNGRLQWSVQRAIR